MERQKNSSIFLSLHFSRTPAPSGTHNSTQATFILLAIVEELLTRSPILDI